MALIDHTYFNIEHTIPNTDMVAVQDRLEGFIVKYEPEMLKELLEYGFYKALITGLAAPTPEQRWLDIRDGAEYTDSRGKLQKWEGLIERPDTVNRYSMIATYVFYFFIRNQQAGQFTGVGVTVPTAENAKGAGGEDLAVSAWNYTSQRANELLCFLEAKKDVYPEWDAYSAKKAFRHFHTINALGI